MTRAKLLFLCLILPIIGYSQGMPIDSLASRFSETFSASQVRSLRNALPIRYDDQRVWGLAVGDFSNDTLPDIAISLYDVNFAVREVTIHLLINEGDHFTDVFQKKYSYYETPIEVGLSTEGSVVSVLQKSDESHWHQEGYTFYAGDLISIDDFDDHKEDIPALMGKNNKAMGHNLYRNFENLYSKEIFYSAKDNVTMQKSLFYTFPAYNRLRYVYPGYGREMSDTTKNFIIKGDIFRHDAADCSIRKALAAYDDDYLYLSISVSDDQVYGGQDKVENNDRVSFWFDSFLGDNRYFIKQKKGSIPQFRTETDSTIYNVTFSLPAVLSQTPKVTVSSAAALSEQHREAIEQIRATVIRDTAHGVVNGYTLKARIPFAYLGYESNPISIYELHAMENQFDESAKKKKATESNLDKREYPTIGFTAVVTDLDDPNHPDEVTQQATSDFHPENPSTFGELVLIPSGAFYGYVKPTYTSELTDELLKAGY
ncbi:MAG TPA: sugar-binding protein [Candidatus Kapabacteria bacterium]|nr:sugar-binding protein [Candidatus Kapabacteria bacterium]